MKALFFGCCSATGLKKTPCCLIGMQNLQSSCFKLSANGKLKTAELSRNLSRFARPPLISSPPRYHHSNTSTRNFKKRLFGNLNRDPSIGADSAKKLGNVESFGQPCRHNSGEPPRLHLKLSTLGKTGNQENEPLIKNKPAASALKSKANDAEANAEAEAATGGGVGNEGPRMKAVYAAMTPEQRAKLAEIVRVDQAGELGAKWIYEGQIAVFGRHPTLGPLLKEMQDQELKHLDTFTQWIPRFRSRPSALHFIWQAAGFITGAGTAMLGKEAAMLCTEAVETVIGEHYNEQLRDLYYIISDPKLKNLDGYDEIVELAQAISQFRDEELEHRETALKNNSQNSPFRKVLTAVIDNGCRMAISTAKKI